jgi:hypothetical protein
MSATPTTTTPLPHTPSTGESQGSSDAFCITCGFDFGRVIDGVDNHVIGLIIVGLLVLFILGLFLCILCCCCAGCFAPSGGAYAPASTNEEEEETAETEASL